MVLEKFKRREQKYLINPIQYNEIIRLSKKYLNKDPYYFTSINSLYFDSINDDLIIESLNKPIYKEKVRLRYYNSPTIDNIYFLEIKKKFKGIVYKRRVKTSYDEIYNYINNKKFPKTSNDQIMKEIDYLYHYYNLIPSMYISYDRYSYIGKDNPCFRLTFDTNVKYRYKDLEINNTDGEQLLNNLYIMEVKTVDSFPFWFIEILSKLKIYPASYSKFGEAHKRRMKECSIA